MAGQVLSVGSIRLRYPEGFIVGNVSVSKLVGISGAVRANVSGQWVSLTGFNTIEPGVKSFTLSNVRSHASKLSKTFMIYTTDDLGNVFDEATRMV